MDFIRAAIKGLFYDYPPELFAEGVLKKKENATQSDVFNPFVHLMKFRETMFTTTELKALEDVVINQWCSDPFSPEFMKIPGFATPFLLLSAFTHDVLDVDRQSMPLVKFDMLLRWRELSIYVGEDILTTAFLAKHDLDEGTDSRINFTWSDVIGHTDGDVNNVLSMGLSDNHSHYGASVDIASFQWIGLMNHIGPYAIKRDKVFDVSNTPVLSLWEYNTPLTFRQWGVLAAAIRVLVYDVLYENLSGNGLDARIALVDKMLEGKDSCVSESPTVQAMIGSRSKRAYSLLGAKEGQDWDYAIPMMLPYGQSWFQSPYMIQYGERRLMYDFLYRLYGHDSSVFRIAPYFYVYHLIKIRYRKELVLANGLKGIDNFKNYNERKKAFQQYSDAVNDFMLRYVCQTGVNNNTTDHIELRMGINDIKSLDKRGVYHRIFDPSSPISCSQVHYVQHFFKGQDQSQKTDGLKRHSEKKKEYTKESRKVLSRIELQKNRPTVDMPQIVGVDAAGSEIGCRPEVFGCVYRELRYKGVKHFTFHAGEDFYDVLDGLRLIDEAVVFLQLADGDHIGHAVALGLNPEAYYENRRRNSVLPRQVLLDNLIWLKFRSQELGVRLTTRTSEWVNSLIGTLYQDCGYPLPFNQSAYRLSMLLRSDDMALWDTDVVLDGEKHKLLKLIDTYDTNIISEAKILCKLYQTSKAIKDAGNLCRTERIPIHVYSDIIAMQEAMMDMLQNHNIGIECCPSSNLLLCPIDRYIDHPLFRFHPAAPYRNHKIKVTVCTDDRGIFATSLRNEYSLLACAMIKTERWSKSEVIDYIKHLVDMGNELRFSV